MAVFNILKLQIEKDTEPNKKKKTIKGAILKTNEIACDNHISNWNIETVIASALCGAIDCPSMLGSMPHELLVSAACEALSDKLIKDGCLSDVIEKITKEHDEAVKNKTGKDVNIEDKLEKSLNELMELIEEFIKEDE